LASQAGVAGNTIDESGEDGSDTGTGTDETGCCGSCADELGAGEDGCADGDGLGDDAAGLCAEEGLGLVAEGLGEEEGVGAGC